MEFKQIADYTIERFHLPETPEAVMDEWNTMAKDAYENKVQIKPGVKELLTALKKGNIPMAVATSNIEALYKPCLKRNGILEYFDAFTECGEVGRGKSFPDIYIRSAEKLGCSRRNVRYLKISSWHWKPLGGQDLQPSVSGMKPGTTPRSR